VIFIEGMGAGSWLCLCPRPQKLSLTEKIRPAIPVLPSHGSNGKKQQLIITCFLVKFCFIRN